MNLNKANLMVGLAAASDGLRRGLDVIRVTPTHTESTNGGILARVSLPPQTDPEEVPVACPTANAAGLEPFSAPAKALSAVKLFKVKQMACLDNALFVDVEKTNTTAGAHFSATDTESTINPAMTKIQSRYPDTERVIPKDEPEFSASFNLAYLETLLKIAKATGIEKIRLEGRGGVGSEKGLCLKAEDPITGQTFFGIIMPLRA